MPWGVPQLRPCYPTPFPTSASGNYGLNMNCAVLINSGGGTDGVAITATAFNTEVGFDNLKVLSAVLPHPTTTQSTPHHHQGGMCNAGHPF